MRGVCQLLKDSFLPSKFLQVPQKQVITSGWRVDQFTGMPCWYLGSMNFSPPYISRFFFRPQNWWTQPTIPFHDCEPMTSMGPPYDRWLLVLCWIFHGAAWRLLEASCYLQRSQRCRISLDSSLWWRGWGVFIYRLFVVFIPIYIYIYTLIRLFTVVIDDLFCWREDML